MPPANERLGGCDDDDEARRAPGHAPAADRAAPRQRHGRDGCTKLNCMSTSTFYLRLHRFQDEDPETFGRREPKGGRVDRAEPREPSGTASLPQRRTTSHQQRLLSRPPRSSRHRPPRPSPRHPGISVNGAGVEAPAGAAEADIAAVPVGGGARQNPPGLTGQDPHLQAPDRHAGRHPTPGQHRLHRLRRGSCGRGAVLLREPRLPQDEDAEVRRQRLGALLLLPGRGHQVEHRPTTPTPSSHSSAESSCGCSTGCTPRAPRPRRSPPTSPAAKRRSDAVLPPL